MDGTSINGAMPPPETIAKTIIPMAPSNPISDAKSIIIPQKILSDPLKGLDSIIICKFDTIINKFGFSILNFNN
jgi:hypothetical protein